MEVRDQRIYLKVKIVSLGDEARTIHRMENQGRPRKATEADVRPELTVRDGKPYGTPKRPKVDYRYKDWRKGLAAHRRFDVRPECRAANLAYAFLRGIEYSRVEPKTDPSTPIRWDRVRKLVERYGIQARDQDFKELMTWQEFKEAKAGEAARLEGWIKSASR